MNLVRYAMKVLKRGQVESAAEAVDRAMRLTLREDEFTEFELS